MNFFADQKIKDELKAILGSNCEPTQELEKILIEAYAKGRTDAFAALGLDESEVPSENGLMAWTA